MSNNVSERRNRRRKMNRVWVKNEFSKKRYRDGEIYVKPDKIGQEVQIKNEFSKVGNLDGEVKIKPEIFEEEVQVKKFSKKRKRAGKVKIEPDTFEEAVQIKKFSKNVKLKPDLEEEGEVEKQLPMKRKTDEVVKIKPDILKYFNNVIELNLDDLTDSEERDCLVANVFEETIGKERCFSCHKVISRAIEKLLPYANVEVLLRFTRALSFDFHQLCCDASGSHVLEQLIRVVTEQIQKNAGEKLGKCDEESQNSDPKIISLQNWLQEVCKFVLDNCEEFLWESHANFIVRTILQCLSGIKVKSKDQCKRSRPMYVTEVSVSPLEEGHALVEEFTNNLMQMPQFNDFPLNNSASGFLQILVYVVHKANAKLHSKLIKHLLDTCYDKKQGKYNSGDQIPEIFFSNTATCLMDTMITVSTGKLFTQIYARCFINRLKSLSILPSANFCVQNLIKHCTEKVEFEAMFVELSSRFHFRKLVEKGKHGILLALVQTCLRLSSNQGQFIKGLQDALHCTQPERHQQFSLLIAYMVDFKTLLRKVSRGEDLFVSLMGSLILQTLLNFPETKKIVNSLLAIENEHLKWMFCDVRGSYIADAFFASKSVGEKSREIMCCKLQGSYVALATSVYGSRALDVVWAWASLKYKKIILEELAPCETLVNSVQCGNIFSDKSGLSLFKRRPEDWEETYFRSHRREKLFSDIIGCRE